MRKHFLILMLLTLLPLAGFAEDLREGKMVIPSTYYGYSPSSATIEVYNKANSLLTLGTDFTFDGFFSDEACNNPLTSDQVKTKDAGTVIWVKVTGKVHYENSLKASFEIKKMPLIVEGKFFENKDAKVYSAAEPTGNLLDVIAVKEKVDNIDRTDDFEDKITFARESGAVLDPVGFYYLIGTVTDNTLAKNYTIESEDVFELVDHDNNQLTADVPVLAMFEITKKPFTIGNDGNLTISVTANLTYNGQPQKATVVVTDKALGTTLTEATFYTATEAAAHNAELGLPVSAGGDVPANFAKVLGYTAENATLTNDEATAYNTALLVAEGDAKSGDYRLAWDKNLHAKDASDENAPNVTITGRGNYDAGTLDPYKFTIKQATLIVTPSADKVYDGANTIPAAPVNTDTKVGQTIQKVTTTGVEPVYVSTATLTFQGFVGTDNAGMITVAGGANKPVLDWKKVADKTANVGKYDIKFSNENINNCFSTEHNDYYFYANDGKFEISQKDITVKVDNLTLKHGVTPTYTITPTGHVTADAAAIVAAITVDWEKAAAGADYDYDLVPRFLTSEDGKAYTDLNDAAKNAIKNYNISGVTKGKLTQENSDLTIALDESVFDLTKVYDGQDINITEDIKNTDNLIIIGLKGDDKKGDIDLTNLTLTAVPNAKGNIKDAGSYQLVLDGASIEGYNITYVPSQYKITRRPVTITVHDQIFVTNTVPTLNGDLYTFEETEAEVEGIVDADKGKVFKLQLNATTLGIGANGKITVDANTYEAIEVVNVGGLDSKYGNYNIFVGNDAPASAVIAYTAVPDETVLTAGNTYYTSNAGAGEFVALGTEVANGTNYFTLNVTQKWGRAIVKAALNMLTIDDTKNMKADLITAATPATPGAAPTPVNITFSNRTLKAGVWYTLVLPFDITVSKFSQAFGYAVVDMFDQTASDGKVHFNLYMGNIPANTPFMFKIDGEKINLNQVYIENKTIIYNPNATEAREGVLFDEIGNPYITDGSDNKLVGFYGKKAADITAPEEGDNMLAPGEYYLNGSGVWTPAGDKGATIGGERAKLVLAANAREILVEEPDGSTTAIACINAEGVAVEANGWYTLDGVKLQGVPTEKGVYIRNGKKMVIK